MTRQSAMSGDAGDLVRIEGSGVKSPQLHRDIAGHMAVRFSGSRLESQVFTTSVKTGYESHNLRQDFRRVTAAAGLGAPWVPKELQTSFVSMMSYQGVPPDSKFVIPARSCARRPIEWAGA